VSELVLQKPMDSGRITAIISHLLAIEDGDTQSDIEKERPMVKESSAEDQQGRYGRELVQMHMFYVSLQG